MSVRMAAAWMLFTGVLFSNITLPDLSAQNKPGAPRAVAGSTLPPKPKLEDFDTIDQFTEAMVVWVANHRLVGTSPAATVSALVEDRLKKLEDRTDLHRRRIDAVDELQVQRYAIVDCNTRKYVEFLPQSSVLPLFGACDSIEPFLEGYRLTIKIGNPHNVAFSDVSGRVGYGATLPDTDKQQVEWSTTSRLEPGAWTRATVTINRIAAKDMRYVTLEKFDVNTAALK